ncbi:uncharacterized protein LTR77_009805 [Saxophila tyrrhenica]|uniref:Major facilitator superfamily (MFS) profile domain-containing protein n=1 Tax=Saxophila tyrrhenica TaxID=1690608 RepID=A0AAV9NZ41_9PEZI|nr:hypothetical protein LTR77_009805 [Saxophila tyrrhenica]
MTATTPQPPSNPPPDGRQTQRPTSGDASPFSTASSEEKATNDARSKEPGEIEILDWHDPSDPANPINYSTTKKWLITGAALFGTLIIPLNGTSITVAHEQLDGAFNVNESSFPHSYWAVTSWSVGGAVFIVVGLPLLEDLGVRLGYLIFYAFFLLMIIPQALAQNFATLIITRFFSGGCVTLLANTVAGIIPDIWSGDRARSVPVSLYILCYLMGSTLGPPMFAGVIQHIGNWRWIFYIQLILYGACLPFFYLTISETRADVILRRRAKRLRKSNPGRRIYTRAELAQTSLLSTLGRSVYRPVYLLATEPVLIASTIWSAFSFGTVFLFTQSTEQVYIALYGWNVWSTGYIQAAIVVGEILGFLTSFLSTKLYFASTPRNTEAPGRPIPEARLYVSIFGSFAGIAGGMFVYAWTAYPSLPWIAPTIGLGMVGFGIQTVVSAVADYIEDAYAVSGYAASAISGVAAGENIVAAFLPLATQRMYTSLGFQWASSLLGFVAVVLSFAPVVFVWKGRELRGRSPFMRSGGQTYASEIKS